MAASSAPLSLSLIFKPRPLYLLIAQKPYSPLRHPSRRLFNLNLPEAFTSKATKRWEISALSYDFLLSEAENSQEIVAASDDGVSTIISSLLLIAFVGLTILTLGVIYIAVTDFLTKRERDKFEKEEAAKKKKGGKKGKVRARARARAGPRGFGQKIQEEDDDDDVERFPPRSEATKINTHVYTRKRFEKERVGMHLAK